MMDIATAKKIDDLEKEVKARGEILDAIAKNLGDGNCWMKVADLDWQRRTRDFAEDAENHHITRREWESFRNDGVTLFLKANFATAYFDDADVIWQEAEDGPPMFHVMVESDPPHRTVIHLAFLVNWICHLAGKCIPVQIVDMEFVGE